MQQVISAAVRPSLAVAGYVRRLVAEFKIGLRHHSLLFAGGATVFGFGYGLSLLTGHMLPPSPADFIVSYVLLAGVIVGFAIAIYKLAHMVLVQRSTAPLAELVRWIRFDILTPARLANGANGMFFVFLLIGGITMVKNNISRFGGFRWDADLAVLDRTLHFGYYPHELLQPLLGQPLITFIIDRNYVMWFSVLFAACFVTAFQGKRSLERHRFLLALLFTWGFGGTIIAIASSSAGPAYFGRVTGLADPYAAHFAYLNEVNQRFGLKALEIQDKLWQVLHGDTSMSLISAMPSMHSAISVLVALACWQRGGLLRVAGTVFASLILLGSVHLGWHYAADTYVGILIAAMSWMMALRISRWRLGRTEGFASPSD